MASLLTAAGQTLWHWALAVAVGLVGALALAMMAWWLRPVRQLLLVLLLGLRATPLLIVVPVVASIFGRGTGVVMAAGVLATLLPAVTAILLGLDRMPERLLELASSRAGNAGRTLRYLVFPYALDSLGPVLRVIGPLALTGVILAEWLATGDGLGTFVVAAQARLDMVESWTATLIVVTLSCLATVALGWLADSMKSSRTNGIVYRSNARIAASDGQPSQ